MKRRIHSLLLCLCLVAATSTTDRWAHGALGESSDSVETDRKALSAERHAATVHTAYTIHEIKSDGATIREYVSSSGIVFAIAWNGLSHPDLTPLLGVYADEFKQAQRRMPRADGRKHLEIKAERVVVERWGHMRNQQGRAYLPALVPNGVTINEIK